MFFWTQYHIKQSAVMAWILLYLFFARINFATKYPKSFVWCLRVCRNNFERLLGTPSFSKLLIVCQPTPTIHESSCINGTYALFNEARVRIQKRISS